MPIEAIRSGDSGAIHHAPQTLAGAGRALGLDSVQSALSALLATPSALDQFRVSPDARPEAGAQPQPGSYTMQAGDALADVARAYGASIDVLVRASGLANPDRVVAAQEAAFPDAGVAVGADHQVVARLATAGGPDGQLRLHDGAVVAVGGGTPLYSRLA